MRWIFNFSAILPTVFIGSRSKKRAVRISFFIFLLFLFPKYSEAQLSFGKQISYENPYSLFYSDTVPRDTSNHFKKKLTKPQKATIMSACVPGLGQAYNKTLGMHSLWKIPVIYAGFGGLGYAFWWNENKFKTYRNALRIRYDGDTATHDAFESRYTDDNLVTLKNYYQRFRDLSVIGMAALYTLQVVDACVGAHLSTFDVGDDLSLHVSPDIYHTPQGTTATIGLRLYYK